MLRYVCFYLFKCFALNLCLLFFRFEVFELNVCTTGINLVRAMIYLKCKPCTLII